nr:probable apyrase 7 [Ipomoea batatas]
MVLNKISETVSAFVARFSTPKTTTTPYVSSGLPPLPGSIHGYNIPNVGQKNKLRLSASLQDFSVYRQHDVEHGDLNPEMERILANSHQGTFFLRENDGSSFSKDRGSPKQPSGWNKWLIVLLVLFLLLIASVLCISLSYYFKLSEGATRFSVVLDCGSTGTRVYVYQASINHNTDSSLPVLLRSMPEGFQRKSKSQSGRAYNRMETEPGLDKLPSSDSKWLLDNAWSLLRGSPFLCKREWVKIISGEDEAYFGWIALNYDAGVLGTRPKKETFGALDLGGSSLQVTFESKESFNDATGLKLSIGPVNHQLTGYSLPGYGLNDAFDKSVAYLFKKLSEVNDADLASGNVEIKHPCLQFGYKEQYIENPPSVRGEFSKGGKHGIPIQLVGSPEWDECSSLAKIVVNSSGSLEGSHPHPTGQFYAMSGFYVVYRFFNLASDANLDVVLQKGQEFCKKSWDVAEKSVAPQPFIEQYCFRAPYIAYLLREGLHISDSNVIIDSGRTTWTLGVALLEAGKAVSTKFEFQNYQIFWMKIKAVLPWIALLASLVLLLCALLCIGNWIPKFFRKRYLPLFSPNNASTTSIMQNPFKFQRWSPISTGDGREKVPLSPTNAATQRRAFDTGYGFGGNGVQLSESSLYTSSSGVTHSYSSGSLGQMQFDSNTMGSFRPPHRSQQRLQSRRSQSREDLHSSLAEANP